MQTQPGIDVEVKIKCCHTFGQGQFVKVEVEDEGDFLGSNALPVFFHFYFAV